MESILSYSYFFEVVFKLGLILGVYLILWRFVLPFVKNQRWHDRIKFYLPVLRNTLLVLLVIEMVVVLGERSPFLVVSVLAITIATLWGYVTNALLGIFFKLQRGDLKGQGIRFDDYAGKVIEMKNTKMEVETEKGEILQVPYSKIVNNVEIRPSAAKHLKSCTVVIEVKEKAFKMLQKEVLNVVGNLPYVVDSVLPKIEVVDQSKEFYSCKVVVYTNDDKFVPLIKAKLLKLSRG
ncbi:mechanosensitive ion channel [Parvicella tangerina]|uniref:Mechanosensitive ion channel family protein n=1 Tax=Parvicella tangerina TaxID=2829795 RepID=A0A916NSC1_9FLAO|nr:mechanosensitive ion channel [Parvicella tangerina]CAG5083484.1 hypothetical protein CRYO30217_02210 [Parvicella tangerina]